jgi:hypothetical protein
MGFLKQITPPPIRPRNSEKKPRLRKDNSRGEKLFHFQLLETHSHFLLFNGNRKLVHKFEKTFQKCDENGKQNQKREIRQFALDLFLNFDGSQRQAGGFTYD